MSKFFKSVVFALGVMVLVGGCSQTMIEAVNSRDTEVVKKALDEGALINTHYENGFTPLLKATANNDFKMVQYLVEKGADVNIAGSIQGSSALHLAVQNSNIGMVKYLIDKKANVNAVNFTRKETPLLLAAKAGNFEIVKYLVEKGADINVDDAYRMSPFYVASSNGKMEIVKYLAEKGAEINKKGINDHTPLSAAAYDGHLDVVKYLVEKGATIDPKDSRGFTPFCNATYYGFIETAKYLHARGADVNTKQIEGWTPLHFAAYYGKLEVVDFLVNAGADINLKNNANQSSLDIATPAIKEYFQRNRVSMLENKQKKEAEVKASAQAKQDQETTNQINNLIIKRDFEGLKLLTEKNPNLVNYIQDEELRLMLTGPRGMKVGDIYKLLKKGKSEMIIVSLIKRVQVPYKEFTLDEIELLTKMELTDKTISAMIDVTTELLKDDRKRKEQEFYQSENRKLMEEKAQPQTIVQTNNQNNNSQLQDKATEILLQEGSKMLLKSLFR